MDEFVLELLNKYVKMIYEVSDKVDDIISDSQIEYNNEIKIIEI